MRTSEILDVAAEKIERHGWVQDILEYRGRMCIRGAIMCARGLLPANAWNPGDIPAVVADHAIAVAVAGTNGYSTAAVEWNNTPGRTAAEVIAMLRAVAMTERAREARLMPVVREPVPA